jgi:hypothetical protein
MATIDHARLKRPAYQYGRLPAHLSIRLLRLSPGESSSPLACVLFDVTLDTYSDYECVSYAWEDPDLSDFIAAGDGYIDITKSSRRALQQLRLPDLPRDLWIDAVCINQRDIEERNRQVQLMQQIYKNARRVVIYLGEATPESDRAMNFLKRMAGAQKWWKRQDRIEGEIQGSDTSSELGAGHANYGAGWRAFSQLSTDDVRDCDVEEGHNSGTSGDAIVNATTSIPRADVLASDHQYPVHDLCGDGPTEVLCSTPSGNAQTVYLPGGLEENADCGAQMTTNMFQRWQVKYKWKLRAWTHRLNLLERRRMDKEWRHGREELARNSKNEGHILFGIPVLYENILFVYFDDMYDEDWRALDQLLTRPWWSRAWVVQEIWSASDATLQCGSTTLKWKTVTKALDFEEAWDDMGSMIQGKTREKEWPALKQRYGLAIHISKRRLLGSRLSSLLWNTWDREATDPRDKVFAILGLVVDNHKCLLSPDYSLSMVDVYTAATLDIIRHEESLDILLAANGLDRSNGLPSWVPDWRSTANTRRPGLFVNRSRLSTLYFGRSMDQVRVHGHGYNACSSLKPVYAFDNCSNALQVSGMPIDVVSEVDETHREDVTEEDALERASALFKKARGKVNLSKSRLEELRTVLCAGPLEPTAKGVMENILRRRRFFMTQERRLAIGPAQMTEGDIVCLIAGCNFPIVLRAEGENYILIGEAYGKSMEQYKDFTKERMLMVNSRRHYGR